MNSKTSLIGAAFGLAVLSVSAHAAPASLERVNQIQRGDAEAKVLQSLGKPENAPTWMNGTHSLVYKLPTSLDPTRVAYVNVGTDNKVINVQFGNDGERN